MKQKVHSRAWLKKHGFTNGLWRLEERAKSVEAKIAYREGITAPRYPLPTVMRIDPLIEYYILRNIYRWLWSNI